MKRFRPFRIGLLWGLVLAAAFQGGCAKNIEDQVGPVQEQLRLARERGAQWCAPKEFASAEAYLDFAITENKRGNVADALNYLTYAKGYASTALEQSAVCRSDLDGDAIIDMEDGDPYRAEDYDGWDDSDGVPDYDNDGDGFFDKEDGCPDSAEDFDGHNDQDGCPDIDNDQDGVPDGVDQCPQQKEDMDGWQDEDGCPDPDNDFDGFLDAEDRCPNSAETKNGYLDDDGCPDIRPQKFMILVPPDVKFSGRSTRLAPSERKAVQNFAVQLMANPDMKVRIEAHSEATSNPDRDLTVTQKQAEEVASALIEAGIEGDRVIAIGFGGQHPVQSPASTANRRIVFVIYQTQ